MSNNSDTSTTGGIEYTQGNRNNQTVTHIIQNISVNQILNNINVGQTNLDLSDRNLDSLNPRIFQFTQLRQLNLSNNELSVLPNTIGNLSNLEILRLENNNLTTVPPTIWIPSLRVLNLSNNQLTQLPELPEDRFTRLSELNLSGNPNLIRLPNTIVRLSVTTEYIPPDNLEVDSPRPLPPPPPPIFLPPVPGG